MYFRGASAPRSVAHQRLASDHEPTLEYPESTVQVFISLGEIFFIPVSHTILRSYHGAFSRLPIREKALVLTHTLYFLVNKTNAVLTRSALSENALFHLFEWIDTKLHEVLFLFFQML